MAQAHTRTCDHCGNTIAKTDPHYQVTVQLFDLPTPEQVEAMGGFDGESVGQGEMQALDFCSAAHVSAGLKAALPKPKRRSSASK